VFKHTTVWVPPEPTPVLLLMVRTTECGDQQVMTVDAFDAEVRAGYVTVAEVWTVPVSPRPDHSYDVWWP
jgi:hypothetical protein